MSFRSLVLPASLSVAQALVSIEDQLVDAACRRCQHVVEVLNFQRPINYQMPVALSKPSLNGLQVIPLRNLALAVVLLAFTVKIFRRVSITLFK